MTPDENSDAIALAIGGPKISQQTNAKNKSLIIINEYSQIYKSSDQGKNSVFANDLLICEKFGNQIQ